MLCALFPKFRDIHHIWEVLVQLGFWATPIIYPISIVPAKYHSMIFLNPMARIIQGSREAIIGTSADFLTLGNHLIISAVALFFLTIGFLLFNKLSKSFAEDL